MTASSGIPRTKILVVDDETELVETMKGWLQANGYEVLTALDGQQALKAVSTEKPDLVILDILMPRMSGLEVLTQLRHKKETIYLPVIMLTGKGETGSIVECQGLGATDYVIKPCSQNELLRLIEKHLYE